MVNNELKSQRLKVTPYGRTLLILSCVLFANAYLFTNLIPALSATAIILFLVYAKLDLRNTIKNPNIDVERTILEKILFANKPFNIVLKIKNNSNIVHLELEDRIPRECSIYKGTNKYSTLISPDKEYKIKYSILASKRGNYTFEGVRATIKDKSNLYRYTMDWTLISDVLVHSDIDTIKEAKTMAKREKLEMTVKTKDRVMKTENYEFDGIRDYIPGDRLKDIEWKSTLRLSKPMTKVYEEEAAIPAVVLLDCSKSMRKTTGEKSKIDHGIQLSLQLIKIFLSWEHPTGFIAFDEYRLLIDIIPSKKRRQFDKIFNTLLYIPDRILVNEYHNYGFPMEPISLKTDSEKQFINIIVPFHIKRKREHPKSTQATGIYEAMWELISTTKANHFILLITDLETNVYLLYQALKLVRKYRHRIVIITPFTHWYNSHSEELNPDRLETIYRNYTEKQIIIKKLRGLGVKVIEIKPQYGGRKIIREIERSSR